MMDDLSIQALKVTQQVFETMFFVPVEFEEDEEEGGRKISAWIVSEIKFEGKFKGKLGFFVPVELACSMVSNFLGLEEDEPTLEQARDVVGELCNMVCGNLFSRLNRKEIWTITSPKTWEGTGPDQSQNVENHRISIPFRVDGYPARLEIQLAYGV